MTTPASQAKLLGPSQGVVYFGNEWFAENRTSSHHIARRLTNFSKVLYVDSPGMRAPVASGRDLRRIFNKRTQALRLPREVLPGLWHCTVPQLPWRSLPGIERLNRSFGAWAVRRAMRHVGIARPILWFVLPHPSFMLDAVPHELAIYYCIDDYAAHPGVDAACMRFCDETLTRRADHVFVAAGSKESAKPSHFIRSTWRRCSPVCARARCSNPIARYGRKFVAPGDRLLRTYRGVDRY